MLFDSDAIFIFYPPQFSVFPDIPFRRVHNTRSFYLLGSSILKKVIHRSSIGSRRHHRHLSLQSPARLPFPSSHIFLEHLSLTLSNSTVKFTIDNHCKFTDEHEIITEFWWKFLYARCDFFYLFGLLK